MFTVILLSDTAKAIFEPARVYFEPFVEDGSIAFCDWNQSVHARTMSEATPELREIIKGKKSWRAVVVDHPGAEDEVPGSELRDPENPFDFLDNNTSSLNLEDSKHALIRVAHILLGYPQMSAKSFQPYLQYEDADTGEIIEGEAKSVLLQNLEAREGFEARRAMEQTERSEDAWFSLATTYLSAIHNNVKRHFTEVAYTEEERQKHAELVERYRMKEVRPSEVIFISTRRKLDADDRTALERAWQTDVEHNSSRFVERNDYPPMSRFAAYDLLEPENSGYEHDRLRFWLSVLTVSTNLAPPGSFQSDRLYMVNIEFEDQGLVDMLNHHVSQLAMVRDHLDRIIAAPERSPEIEVKDLMLPIELNVTFDNLGSDELMLNDRGYGLAADAPRDELRRWQGEVARVTGAAAVFMRKPRRAVARSVLMARAHLRREREAAMQLNAYDREELEDELTKRLRGLVVPDTTALLEKQRLQRVIDEGSNQVKRFVAQRMRANTIVAAALITIGVWVAVSVPYLGQLALRGGAELFPGLLLVGGVLGIIALTFLVVLLVSRARLRSLIDGVNQQVQTETTLVRHGASKFAEYLSEYVSYRYGAETVRDSERAAAMRTQRLRRLRALRDKIVVKVAEEKNIVMSLGAPVEVHRMSQGLVDFDPEDELVENQLFRFPEGERQIPFNVSGDKVAAPYDFIRRLTLERYMLFERRLETPGEGLQ